MTTKRLAVLFLVLLTGMSVVFALPKVPVVQPQGIDMTLPKMIGGKWYGRELEISDREHGGLGPETEFSRKSYTDGRGDEIFVSFVLAGHDMNTSIHRPEWCLPSQGWTIAGSGKSAIALPDRGTLTVTRLLNQRVMRDGEGKPVADNEGNPVLLRNVDYYWFVGYDAVTPSHFGRQWRDVTDRLVRGYNQRWAFISVASNVTERFRRDGLSEQEVDEMLKDFIRKLVPLTHKETVRF